MAWPKASPERWARFIPQCSVRERDLFGFPRPGDPYWCEDALTGVAARYPGIDLTPYREAAGGIIPDDSNSDQASKGRRQ
jgi:hypothetical protein